MEVRLYQSAEEFSAAAGDFYRRDPVIYTTELTSLRARSIADDAAFLSAWCGGELVGAAMRTAPRRLLCSGLPTSAIPSAAMALAEALPALTGVEGLRDTALDFADAWRTITGAEVAIDTEERLYRLGRLWPRTGVVGEARFARW